MKTKTTNVKSEGAALAGECFEHDIRWFSGGTECPVCKLESRMRKINRAMRMAKAGFDASRTYGDLRISEKYIDAAIKESETE